MSQQGTKKARTRKISKKSKGSPLSKTVKEPVTPRNYEKATTNGPQMNTQVSFSQLSVDQPPNLTPISNKLRSNIENASIDSRRDRKPSGEYKIMKKPPAYSGGLHHIPIRIRHH